jgi:hypothetical protein
MATWKKVIVSGSAANLTTLQVDNLTSGQVVIGGGASNLSTTAINGTGNIVATTNASGLVHSGSFSGSFTGNGANLTGITATATWPVTQLTTISGTTQVFVNDGSNKYADITTFRSASWAPVSGDITINSSTGVATFKSGVVSSSGAGTSQGQFKLNGVDVSVNNLGTTGTPTFASLNVSNDVTITGNLAVNGSTTFVNTTNTYIEDQFLLINSGAAALGDSGIIAQYNAAGSGSALFLESTSTNTYGRWAVAYDLLGNVTSATPDEFMVTAKVNQGSAPSAAPTWGGSSNGMGNMWTTSTGDIYIYA